MLCIFAENKLKKLQTHKQPEVSGIVKLKPNEIICQLRSLNEFQLRQPTGGNVSEAFYSGVAKDCGYINGKLHPELIGVTSEELARLVEHDQLVETVNSQTEQSRNLAADPKTEFENQETLNPKPNLSK